MDYTEGSNEETIRHVGLVPSGPDHSCPQQTWLGWVRSGHFRSALGILGISLISTQSATDPGHTDSLQHRWGGKDYFRTASGTDSHHTTSQTTFLWAISQPHPHSVHHNNGSAFTEKEKNCGLFVPSGKKKKWCSAVILANGELLLKKMQLTSKSI